MVLEVGPGAHIYKRDLRHAYRQIPVDPADYRYLGYFWQDMLYFDSVLAMGQRNAAMACSRTTNAVIRTLMVENVAGTKCREIFLAIFAALSTVFCSFCLFRDIKYSRPLKVRFLARFNTRDFFYSRLFHF